MSLTKLSKYIACVCNFLSDLCIQEEKMNIAIIKRIMSEKKTSLPSLRNWDWKTIKTKTKNINELLTHISKNNIKELSEFIYAIAISVYDKIGVLLMNANRNSKPWWKIRQETQIRNLWQAKMIREKKNAGACWDKKRKTTQLKQKTHLTIYQPLRSGRIRHKVNF